MRLSPNDCKDQSSERDTQCRTDIRSYDADQLHVCVKSFSTGITVSMALLALSDINVQSSMAYTRNVPQAAADCFVTRQII